MSDLIDRRAAIKWVKTECNPYGKPTLDFESGKKVIEHLERMPPAHDPVKRGKWESDEFLYTTGQTICSACKTGFYIDDLLNVGEGAQEFLPNYCPHCGAMMEQEGEK